MEENLKIWDKYKEVPSNALKSFDNGKFKGTDINTMWRLKSLTDEFGMCGFGWYFDIVKTWTETISNGEIFAFAEIKLYVKVGGEWSKGISGNGGSKLARVLKDDRLSTSDEAFKMAVTDAIGVACRNLGFGANVYWDNDKTKYTEKVVEEVLGGAYLIEIGKYAGMTIKEIYEKSPKYIAWLYENARNMEIKQNITKFCNDEKISLEVEL